MSGIARDKLTKEEVSYLDGLETELEKLRKETGTVEKSEFEKALDSLPEPVRKQMIADREEVAKLRDEREEQTFITKARGLESVPGVSPQEFGKVLRRISKGQTTPEDEQFVLDSMRSASELAKNGNILTERISEAAKSGGGGARAQLMQKAREYAAQNDVPVEVAVGKVRKDPTNRELVAKDREEMEEVNS